MERASVFSFALAEGGMLHFFYNKAIHERNKMRLTKKRLFSGDASLSGGGCLLKCGCDVKKLKKTLNLL